LLALAFGPAAAADEVSPSPRVATRLNVRAKPAAGSPVVGALRPGEKAALVATRAGWHEVRLAGGATGFVSADWVEVLAAPAPPAPPASFAIPVEPLDTSARDDRPGAFSRFFRRLLGRGAPVELVIAQPALEGSIYRHVDPELPVAGYARALGVGRSWDVVLVLDSSTSTNEHAGADVNGDGRAEAGWKGADSIYRAQLSAAASLLHALASLPQNRGGERIRVGVVTCAGEDRHRLSEQDADLDVNLETVRWLAHRDARVEVPLTHDYAAVERGLGELWGRTPIGMTDVAAGIARAVIELTGDTLRGAESEPRADAEKVILFLSDGKPMLPHDKEKAEQAASYAGKLASEYGIRINAFALGKDVVSRRRDNVWIRRMAQRSGGRLVALDRPGEIVEALRDTPLSLVDRVRVRNVTLGHESPRIATGIDGSFYAEVPLEEGENEIEVEALLDDGGAGSQSFRIAYVKGAPTRELEEQLASLRAENAALAERVRSELAGEIERARAAQERRLELSVPRGAAASGEPARPARKR
jgi:hypothetical protein